jgi:hypothetical protein
MSEELVVEPSGEEVPAAEVPVIEEAVSNVVSLFKEYVNVALEEGDKILVDKLRVAFSDLHGVIVNDAPKGRYQSLALTALEQAALWAIKSVAHKA